MTIAGRGWIAGGALALLSLGAAPMSRPHAVDAPECLEDRELAVGGIAVGDTRRAMLRRLRARRPVARADTVYGADFDFFVTRYTVHGLEVTISESTGRVAALVPTDPRLPLPRAMALGMHRREIARRLAPAELSASSADTLWVYGCGPRGSGMKFVFGADSALKGVSLNGFYPATDE